MNGSSGNFRQQGHDYWLYLPDFAPARTSPYPRGQSQVPWWLFEDRSSIRGSNYGLSSIPSSTPPRSSVRLLLIDDYNTYPRPQNHSSPNLRVYNQEPEEQNEGAITKLRKQLYSPHISNIVKRLGSSKSSNTNSSVKDDNYDDVGKRCAICLEDFETKQFVTVTPCNHMFHEECIVPWVKSKGKCPVCRFLIA